MAFIKILLWACVSAVLAAFLYSLFGGHLMSPITLHYGGKGGEAFMAIYIPLIAFVLPLALVWAIKVIRNKK